MAAFATLILAGSGTAQDNTGKGSTAKGADHRFIMDAAQGGMAEVKLGELATQKASSPDVKQFGRRMIDDHTKANEQLKSIASQQNITLPTGMGTKNQATYDHLSKLSGTDFDIAYMQHMTMDHRKDVAEFKKEANNGKDQAVKNFASQTLPTLEDHLRMAEDVHAKVNGSTSADRSKGNKKKQ